LSTLFTDRVVLITGGTGSFGKKFTEILLKEHRPRAIRVYSRDELKQHEMSQKVADARMRYLLGDIRDKDRLKRALNGVDIVVHAAALKQVPACEYNPFEAVQTNILGTKNVIDACIDCGVQQAILIGTDKAVNPVNLYGATKLCAEKLFVQGNSYSGGKGTIFSASRYGNVVGSRGSVIPVFLAQRERGFVTITDPRMTRFWLTLDQGVRFVMRCLEIMRGGEIFVPKIPSMRITDLAEVIAPGCEQRFTGIRPGEKVHEVLVSEDEARHTLENNEFFMIVPQFPWWDGPKWNHGNPVSHEFSYCSDTNPQWLDREQLRAILEGNMKLDLGQESPESSTVAPA